jgi:hypothetical protein
MTTRKGKTSEVSDLDSEIDRETQETEAAIAEARKLVMKKKVEKQKKQLETLRLLKEQMEALDKSDTSDVDQQFEDSQDDLNSEILALRAELAALKADRAHASVSANNSRQKEWDGDLDYTHPEIESIAKAIHKRFKDFELPMKFNYAPPNYKGDLSEASILWTNLCSIIKIIILRSQKKLEIDADLDILALVLNMCKLLADKRDLAVITSQTDEATAQIFKSLQRGGDLLSERNKAIFSQTISMREAQVRVGVNLPRQRENNNNNNYGNFSRNNNNRGRGFRRDNQQQQQRGQVHQKAANNFSNNNQSAQNSSDTNSGAKQT